jgi:predicted RNA-binding Zn ribbon-like protein
VLISHDTKCALNAVVDLLNTMPESDGPDRLPDVASLREFVERNKVSEVQSLAEPDLPAMRSVRDRLAQVFAAEGTQEAATLINKMVAEAGTTPRLTDHDGYDWHVHYFAPGASVADRLAADGGMALAFLLVSGERERLRRCDAPSCRRAFVDLSRNRSRRFCDSRTCGNRLHVAAYRARRREAGSEGP